MSDNNPQQDSGQQYGYNPNEPQNQQYGYNPNEPPPAQQPGYNPNAGPQGYNPNMQPGMNQQPGYNPNMQPGMAPNQPYNPNQYQPPYGSPQQPQGNVQWPHMKIGDWMIATLLMLIPIVNIVLMFMWAFGSNVNPSKKSFFQAALIWALIGIGAGIILGGIIFAALGSMLGGWY